MSRPVLVCTLGDLLLDVIVRPRGALAIDGDTASVTRTTAGGQAANVAAWVVELGGSARLICKRGDDAAGAIVSAEVERRGVQVRGPVAGGRTGVVVSLVDGEGRRTMASDRGSAADLRPEEISDDDVDGCDVLHISGYSLLREPILHAAIWAAGRAPRVSLDLSSASDIRRFGVRRFRELVWELEPDVVFANEEERSALGPLDADWVVKLGPRGARFPAGELAAHAAEAIDSTGAGDALAAGYLVGGPELALDAAARCVGQLGAMP